MKIAIIGTGISGLGISYLLNPHHDITVYEKNDYKGGHSRTINVEENGVSVPVDTGFIVYNERNYFHFTRLLNHLNVPVQKSEMSFGSSIACGWLEYSSKSMFAQKSNFLRPKFWGMIADIIRFNKQAMTCVKEKEEITLRDCLDRLKMGDWFRQYYLLAMGAAIWSCSLETILDYPARTFLKFFENHGLLTLNDQPQWHTITGGSREYVSQLTAPFKDKIKTSHVASVVKRVHDGIIVCDKNGSEEKYERIVFACHADEALKILQNPTHEEMEILGSFSYQPNSIYVHCDESFMPKRKKAWASWVYLSEERSDKKDVVSLTYWMNNLQGLETKRPLFITLNPGREPNASLVYDKHVFSHPIFDSRAIHAQKEIPSLQGKNGTYFCGAYQRYGFHEDGLLSAVNVAKEMGIMPPWI